MVNFCFPRNDRKENVNSTTLQHDSLMQKSDAQEIEAYLHSVSEEALPGISSGSLLEDDEDDYASLTVPREYQSAITTFESPLMEYIRNLQVKITVIPKEMSFISSIYFLTDGGVINIVDYNQGQEVKEKLFRLLYPLAKNARVEQRKHEQFVSQKPIEHEVTQILNRCYLVLFSNFSQMQAVIIQGIIYDIERQGVHLPIQSSIELDIIAQQYRPILQNQAVIIRNMFRHLFPEYVPPDNIHILELCFLGLLEDIQHNFKDFLDNDEQLLQMLSRIKVAQDELLNVKDPNLCNILAKMERIQNRIHDIYNQRWRDGVLNDIISTFFYHARFTAYLENKGKIAQKRRYFLASLEHLLNNYEDLYHELLVPQVDLLMEEYKSVDEKGTAFVRNKIETGRMKKVFQTILDEDRFSVLSEMIVPGDFSKKLPDYNNKSQYTEELEKMHQELRQKHQDHEKLIEWVDRLWDIIDDLQELFISESFAKWKGTLTTVLNVYCNELFWFHACFSTYTIEAFPNKHLLFQELEHFITPYKEVVRIFSDNILQRLESLSQQVYAFRDRAGDFNLLYTGILSIDLRKEEKEFQFELYTPCLIKELATELVGLEERYVQSLQFPSPKVGSVKSPDDEDIQKNYRLYTEEILKIAGYLAEERDMLMYYGSRKLFTGPQFDEEDFAHLYNEVIDIYEYAIKHMQIQSSDPLDNIIELRSLRERAHFEAVYERYTEVVKYRALRKAWELLRKRK